MHFHHHNCILHKQRIKVLLSGMKAARTIQSIFISMPSIPLFSDNESVPFHMWIVNRYKEVGFMEKYIGKDVKLNNNVSAKAHCVLN